MSLFKITPLFLLAPSDKFYTTKKNTITASTGSNITVQNLSEK